MFENFPVVLGSLVIRLLRQHLDDVHNGEEPCLGLFIVDAADFAFLEDGWNDFHRACVVWQETSLVAYHPEILGCRSTSDWRVQGSVP